VKLGAAIEEVHRSEAVLARELLALGERHKADHDVYHLSRTLAKKAHERLEALEPLAERYGASVDGDAADDGLGPHPSGAGLPPLLRDMRTLHLLAAEASINWTMLGQAAQAARDSELLSTVSESHPEAIRALRWTTTKLKESAPQLLTS
jgi:hypothetical protein